MIKTNLVQMLHIYYNVKATCNHICSHIRHSSANFWSLILRRKKLKNKVLSSKIFFFFLVLQYLINFVLLSYVLIHGLVFINLQANRPSRSLKLTKNSQSVLQPVYNQYQSSCWWVGTCSKVTGWYGGVGVDSALRCRSPQLRTSLLAKRLYLLFFIRLSA